MCWPLFRLLGALETVKLLTKMGFGDSLDYAKCIILRGVMFNYITIKRIIGTLLGKELQLSHLIHPVCVPGHEMSAILDEVHLGNQAY